MYQQQYRFELTGLSPLIMHWDNIEWADQIEVERTRIKDQEKAKFKAGDDRCPPETWKGYTYNDGKVVIMPSDNIAAMLKKAGARVTLDKKKSFKELTQAAILFDDIGFPFLVGTDLDTIAWSDIDGIGGEFPEQCEQAKALGFQLFAKRAAVGRAKHVRVRPKFDVWSVKGSFTVVEEALTVEKLTEIFGIGGRLIGLGDWRPGSQSSPGPYGRFACELVAM